MGMIDKIQFVPSTEVQNAAIATTGCRGPIVDMQGAEGAILTFQQSSGGTTGGIAALRIMGSTANSTGSAAPLGGSTANVVAMTTAIADKGQAGITMDGKFWAVDVVKPVGDPAMRYIWMAADNTTTWVHFSAFKYSLRRQGSSDVALASSQVGGTTGIIGAATS